MRYSWNPRAIPAVAALVFFAAPVARGQVTEVWASRYSGVGPGDDAALAVTTDGSGNVYVTGRTGVDAAANFATVKYDPLGVAAWVRTYDGPASNEDVAVAIAVDGGGNVYVTGYSVGVDASDTDYATVKYDALGTQLWAARYNSPVNQPDEPAAICLDADGNVYVTGRSSNSGLWFDYDYATVKYAPDGSERWVARYNGAGDDWDEARAIAVDALGNVYVTGTAAFGVGTAFHDYATIKYNASGVRQWVAFYDGVGENWDEAQGLALDASGNVIVTGYSSGNGTGWDVATVKYTPLGSEVWARVYDGPGSGVSHDIGITLALDEAGNVYVGATSALDYATVKYSAAGEFAWDARHGAGGDDQVTAIAVDPTGVYVTGKSVNDFVTLKYDFSGAELWEARYNGPGHGADGAAALALDADANVLVTGTSLGSGTGMDFATVKYTQETVAVGPAGAPPAFVALDQNRPNPFRSTTTIRFEAPEMGDDAVSLRIFDAAGREVETLVDGKTVTPGVHEIAWDASTLSPGTYFLTISAGGRSMTRRLVLVR